MELLFSWLSGDRGESGDSDDIGVSGPSVGSVETGEGLDDDEVAGDEEEEVERDIGEGGEYILTNNWHLNEHPFQHKPKDYHILLYLEAW